jgi:hypothetical protein
MQNFNGLNREEQEIESALGSLVPANASIDPIAAAFSAGRRSGARRVRVWQSVVVVALMFAVGSRMLPTQPQRIARAPDPFPPAGALRIQPAEPFAPQSLQALQNIVFEKGVEALPSPNFSGVPALRAGNSL